MLIPSCPSSQTPHAILYGKCHVSLNKIQTKYRGIKHPATWQEAKRESTRHSRPSSTSLRSSRAPCWQGPGRSAADAYEEATRSDMSAHRRRSRKSRPWTPARGYSRVKANPNQDWSCVGCRRRCWADGHCWRAAPMAAAARTQWGGMLSRVGHAAHCCSSTEREKELQETRVGWRSRLAHAVGWSHCPCSNRQSDAGSAGEARSSAGSSHAGQGKAWSERKYGPGKGPRPAPSTSPCSASSWLPSPRQLPR